MNLSPPFDIAKYGSDTFNDWPQWRKNMGLGPHRGKDWSAPNGAVIPASGSGVCTGEGWSAALGWWVVVRYATPAGEVYIGYCHMQLRTHLRYGVWVANRDKVGIVGNTGSATTGAHLHMTASWVNGNPGTVPVIDPMQFFATSSTAGGESKPVTPTTPKVSTGDEMIRIQSTNRGIALIGPGYFRGIANNEELENSGGIISAHLTGNDRQFDLWVAMAFGGQSSNSALDQQNAAAIAKDWAAQVEGNAAIKALGTLDVSKIDTNALGKAVAANLGQVGGISAADKAEILAAINGVDEATLATFGLKRA